MELTQTATAAMELLPTLEDLKGAYESKNWLLLAGILLTALVFLGRKLSVFASMDPKHSRWIAVGLAMAGAMGSGLMMGKGLLESSVTGLLTGLTAIGVWETAGKTALK